MLRAHGWGANERQAKTNTILLNKSNEPTGRRGSVKVCSVSAARKGGRKGDGI